MKTNFKVLILLVVLFIQSFIHAAIAVPISATGEELGVRFNEEESTSTPSWEKLYTTTSTYSTASTPPNYYPPCDKFTCRPTTPTTSLSVTTTLSVTTEATTEPSDVKVKP